MLRRIFGSLRARLTLGVGFMLASAVAAVAVSSAVRTRAATSAQQSQARYYRGTVAATQLVARMEGMETALEGYLVTRDPSHLAAYGRSQATAVSLENALRNMPAAAQARQVDAAAEAWQADFAVPTLARARAGGSGLAAAAGFSWQDHGHDLFHAFRSAIAGYQAAMDRWRAAVAAADAAAAQRTMGRVAGIAALAQLLGLLAMAALLAGDLRALARLRRGLRNVDGDGRTLDVHGSRELRALGEEIQAYVDRSRANVDRLHSEVDAARRGEQSARADRELQRRLAKLRADFLADMSHELRTPLNSVIGFADLLASDRLPERQARYAEHILTSGRHLLGIVNDILDIAKIDAGRLALTLQPVDLATLVSEATDSIRPQVDGKGQILKVGVSADLVCWADPARLRQVCLNLLSNAIKFTPEGGSIAVTARAAGEQVVMEVRDTGIGIDAADLGRIFDEFVQVSSGTGRAVDGTGLGLSVTKRLVGLMGGTISVASTPGQGSCFQVELVAYHGRSGHRAGSGPAVLTAEDDPDLCQLFVQALGQAGLDVHRAGSGRAAGTLPAVSATALAVVDLLMGDGDGSWLPRRLHEACVPAVVVSVRKVPPELPPGGRTRAPKPVLAPDIVALATQALAAPVGGG